MDGQTAKGIVLDQDRCDEMFVVMFDTVVFEQSVVKRLHLKKAGFILGQHGARIAVAAERPLSNAAVFTASPGYSPMVQLQNLGRNGVDKQIDDILIRQKVASLDGIPGMKLDTVAILRPHYGGSAALGRNRMGTHQLILGNDGNV